MLKRFVIGLIFCVVPSVSVHAAEITACIIDTSIKTNKVFYYFPLSNTLLRCDHSGVNKPVSLGELYALNWRLIHVESPVLVDQGKENAAYTPPVLYLERTEAPNLPQKMEKAATEGTSTETADETESSSGGLFNWLGGDSTSPGSGSGK
jgi:hypothetical protein